MRKRPMLIAVALILATAAVLAVPEGPEDRFTGAPGDTGDCTSCHSDFPVNSGSGSVNISENTTLFTASYLPGGSYTIVVKVTQTGQKRWGFQMTALRDDNGAGAGNFVIIDPANTQKSTSGNRQYVKQTLAGSHAGTPDGPVFYDVNWTAPANGTGNVTFYAAANAANDDDFETGDYIYTTARRALADVPGPSTVFASPSDGARLEGDVTVRVQASTTIGLRDIVLKIDGSVVASGPSSPLVWVWDTRSSPNGSHVLSSTATDLAGKASSTSINVRVDNDLATPTLSVLSPAPGAKLNGTVAVVADANDDRGAPEVTFRLDGVVTQVNSTLPYVWLWNTSNARNGNHSLNVTAEDTAGHVAAREFGVVVDNKLNDSKPPEVAIVSPLPGRVEGVIVIEAHATDESGVAEAEFWHDDVLHQKNLSSGPRFVWVWETHLDANHSHLVKFKAYDIAGNEAVAEAIYIGDNDRTPPTARFLGPKDGDVVRGIIDIVADARDDRTLDRVAFLLDGKERQVNDSGVAPYRWRWNSSAGAEGPHAITVEARDAAGNDAQVTINVTVDRTAPSVRFLAPGFAKSVGGTYLVKVAASDTSMLARIVLLLEGVEVAAGDAASLNWSWDTTTLRDGIYTFVARATDAAGNEAEARREVAVLNTAPEGQPERGPEQWLPVAAVGAGWAALILAWAVGRRYGPRRRKEASR